MCNIERFTIFNCLLFRIIWNLFVFNNEWLIESEIRYFTAANPGTVAQTYDYGYGRPAPAATYDATKTYYQQPAATAATYTSTETHYQAAKPAYSTTSAYSGTARQATTTGQAKSYQASGTAYQQSNPAQNATYSSGYTAPAAPAAAPSTPSNSKHFFQFHFLIFARLVSCCMNKKKAA